MTPEFMKYQEQIVKNAKTLADKLMELGYNLVSGGTDNHLMLVDLINKGITGKQAEKALEEAGITVNKNMVPFDPQKPWIASGIRIGTPAVTTRGMKEKDMGVIAELINRVLNDTENQKIKDEVREEVENFCKKFV
jgi:glycine hydroxymethyltransferase